MSRTVLIIFVIIFLTNGVNYLYAQDKIITTAGDTIECEIIRIGRKSITFEQFSGGIKTKVKTERKDLASWIINEPAKEMEPLHQTQLSDAIRISFNGGVGYRTASTKEPKENLIDQGFLPKDVDSYFKQIKTGYKLSGKAHYMFWENLGLGVDYQFHSSSGSLSGYVDPGDGTMVYAKIEDKSFTNYVGFSMYSQHWIKANQLKLFSQISMGLTMYREESVIYYSPILFTGKAFGGNVELGLEYFLTNNMSIAISSNFFQSSISKITMNNGTSSQEVELEDEQIEGLSRIDLGLGIQFYF